MKPLIYLDNSATTKQYDEIFEYIIENKESIYGNPSSLHRLGLESEIEVKKSREILSKALYCKTNEIIFTSSGTEANNLAILGYLRKNKRKGKKIITTKMEHPSVKNVFESLEKEGYEVIYIENDNNGCLDINDLEGHLDSNVSLVSIMHINNETGSINDIETIGKLIKNKNKDTVFHVDGVQSFLKIDLNIKTAKVDLFSLSGHKIHAFKGIGALYKNENIMIEPIMFGGGQESELRSGTENTFGIISLGIAINRFIEENKNIKKIKAIKELMIDELKDIDNVKIVSPDNSSPFILSLAFPKIPAETMVHFLEGENIFVSPGAACSSKKKDRSHVLIAMKIEEKIIDSTVRFSFCYNNEIEDIKIAIEKIKEGISTLRKVYK